MAAEADVVALHPGPFAPAVWGADDRVTLRCAAVLDVTHDVKSFVLEPVTAPGAQGAVFDFEPGQFITLLLEIDGMPVSRCYTISSPPTRPHRISITVKRVSNGPVSNWLHDTVVPGTELTVAAPGGAFTLTAPAAGSYLFLSAGSGITPLMSMTRTLVDLGADADIAFVHSARTPADIVFRRELDAHAGGLLAGGEVELERAQMMELQWALTGWLSRTDFNDRKRFEQVLGLAREWILALKHGGRPDLARPLGRLLGARMSLEPRGDEPRRDPSRGDEPRVLVPVPLHVLRRLERGHDQLGVAWIVFNQDQGERVGLHALQICGRSGHAAAHGVSHSGRCVGAHPGRRRAQHCIAAQVIEVPVAVQHRAQGLAARAHPVQQRLGVFGVAAAVDDHDALRTLQDQAVAIGLTPALEPAGQQPYAGCERVDVGTARGRRLCRRRK